MRIAITGARGRLAPAIVAALREHAVWEFSRIASGRFFDVQTLPDARQLENFDAVLHLGWSTLPLLSEQNPGIEEREDLPFARRLAEAAASMPVPPQVVFFSTAAIYGNTGSEPATEDSPCRPLGRYAAMKAEAERIISRIPGACILRITNVFGSLVADKPQGIVPRLYKACHGGEPVTIWGDGSATKDYLHEDDLAEAVSLAVGARLAGTYNVASGHSLSLRELITLVEKATGRSLARTHAPHFPWDVEYSAVSAAHLTAATDWRPLHNPTRSILELMTAP